MKMKNLMKKTILALGIIGVSATSFAATKKPAPNSKKQVQTQPQKKTTGKTAKKPATKATKSTKSTTNKAPKKTVNNTPVKKTNKR